MKSYKNDFFKNIIKLQWRIIILLSQIFNQKILFWGASLFLKDFLESYAINSSNILGIVDRNPYKSVKRFAYYDIVTPEDIGALNPNFIICSVKNNHKKVYVEVKSYLKKNFPKIKLLADSFMILDFFHVFNNNSSIINEVNKIIKNIGNKKNVYLFQYSFFDKEGENFFSGGAERYMLDLAEIIANMNYTPILIQAGNGKDLKPWIKTKKKLTIIGVNSFGESYFDIINQLQPPSLAIYSGIIDWNNKTPYKNSILISHGITWDNPIRNADIKSLKDKLKLANSIVSVDTNTISWFRSTFSNYLAEHKIIFKYIPNYVDLKKYTPKYKPKEKIKITFPRRCSNERGVMLFANIVPKLLDNYSNIEIEFVGFIHTEEIKDTINYLISLYPSLVMHCVCNQEDMVKVYQSTDISIIPTQYSEGTSLSCIESMACGNAIISTNIGGLPNLIIDDFNGKLINPNEEELYNAITELLDNNELRKYLSNNAIATSKAFSKEKWKNEWYKTLESYLF